MERFLFTRTATRDYQWVIRPNAVLPNFVSEYRVIFNAVNALPFKDGDDEWTKNLLIIPYNNHILVLRVLNTGDYDCAYTMICALEGICLPGGSRGLLELRNAIAYMLNNETIYEQWKSSGDVSTDLNISQEAFPSLGFITAEQAEANSLGSMITKFLNNAIRFPMKLKNMILLSNHNEEYERYFSNCIPRLEIMDNSIKDYEDDFRLGCPGEEIPKIDTRDVCIKLRLDKKHGKLLYTYYVKDVWTEEVILKSEPLPFGLNKVVEDGKRLIAHMKMLGYIVVV